MKLPSFLKKDNFSLYLLLLAPLPLIFFISLFFLNMHDLEDLSLRVIALEEKTAELNAQKQQEERLLAHLKKSDANFLEKCVESLSFAHAESHLQFSEDQPRTSDTLEESEVKQKQPVYMNEEELRKTLSLIENVRIGINAPEESAPYLLIKSFDLAKKMQKANEEAFEVSLELIKREPRRDK